jgi:hypothetical protein
MIRAHKTCETCDVFPNCLGMKTGGLVPAIYNTLAVGGWFEEVGREFPTSRNLPKSDVQIWTTYAGLRQDNACQL